VLISTGAGADNRPRLGEGVGERHNSLYTAEGLNAFAGTGFSTSRVDRAGMSCSMDTVCRRELTTIGASLGGSNEGI